MKRFAATAVLMLAALFSFSGCVTKEKSSQSHQEQRDSFAGKTTADVVNSVQTTPPDLTITTTDKHGTTVEVKQPVHQESTTAASTTAAQADNSASSESAKKSETIPLGTKLILLAIGITLLGVIWFVVIRSNRAVSTAWKVGEEFIARCIDRVRTMAQVETDPAKANLLNTITGALQAERAEFNKD